jgi:Na+/serine symporter
MTIIASVILFVFLLETDAEEARSQLVNFPLSICWALLVGTYSVLVVVIADLLQPLSCIQNVLKATNQSPATIQADALLKTRDPEN